LDDGVVPRTASSTHTPRATGEVSTDFASCARLGYEIAKSRRGTWATAVERSIRESLRLGSG